MQDLGNVCKNVRFDLMRVITLLAVLQSIDPDYFLPDDPDALNKVQNLLYGVKEIADSVQKDIYQCVLELERV